MARGMHVGLRESKRIAATLDGGPRVETDEKGGRRKQLIKKGSLKPA
jgi:hypothetical protein